VDRIPPCGILSTPVAETISSSGICVAGLSKKNYLHGSGAKAPLKHYAFSFNLPYALTSVIIALFGAVHKPKAFFTFEHIIEICQHAKKLRTVKWIYFECGEHFL